MRRKGSTFASRYILMIRLVLLDQSFPADLRTFFQSYGCLFAVSYDKGEGIHNFSLKLILIFARILFEAVWHFDAGRVQCIGLFAERCTTLFAQSRADYHIGREN